MADLSFFLNKRHDGFTRMEILVVIIILGLLAIVPILNFRNAEASRRDTRRKSDLRQIYTAMEAYFAQNGKYPMASKDGRILGCTCGVSNPEPCHWRDSTGGPREFCDINNIVYLKEVFGDPTGITEFCYLSDGNRYQLYAKLELPDDFEAFPNMQTKECNKIQYNFGVSSPNTAPLDK
ncbi:hypothetical protein COT44_00155 [Candidatus Shapirobacteria bacterium CG08_land_8_20_14_0_20_39_18]|uniref:Type II secretion system protein GspG C-terminal domain-containing protein n=1 Tax=Candidatus Shapirobacteria bacterium CG08_land_8_20_14_0_20_39_18 TaxID=1974883 RepID=A0A2M6XEF9_9BACT|nr:MAG: hypothetical protein COT44_00155 [Candidatus Shapirobacteria bacterium CG08_land_8_20_14_0_20_39_18]PIY66114.1 MAG: hypothetical protein COY91_01425 [Candidatus Shapirobacteria bacterium CG_4_10_14_0_8_um_filter_39_15]